MLSVNKYLRVDCFNNANAVTRTVLNNGKRGHYKDVVVNKPFSNVFHLTINAYGYDYVRIDVRGEKGHSSLTCYPDEVKKKDSLPNLISNRRVCMLLNTDSKEDHQRVRVRGCRRAKNIDCCCCLLFNRAEKYSEPIDIVVRKVEDDYYKDPSLPPPPPPSPQ